MKDAKSGRVDVVRWVRENAEGLPELRWLYRLSGKGGKRPVKVMNMDEGADLGCVFLMLPKGIYYGLCIELAQEGDAQIPSRFLGGMAEAGLFAARLAPGAAVEALREYCGLRAGEGMEAQCIDASGASKRASREQGMQRETPGSLEGRLLP